MADMPLRDDPIWHMALDWLMRVHAAPDDESLRVARDSWIAQDQAHARAYRRAERVWQVTGALPSARVIRPLDAGNRMSRPARGLRASAWCAAALAAAILLLIVLPDARDRLRADYATGVAESRVVTLADGSSVQLDADSTISVDYSQTRRAVHLLSGQAYFRVSHGDARAFTTTVGEVTVTVTGTAFNVDIAADAIMIAVESGSVTVAGSWQGQQAEVRLAPGEGITVDRATGAFHTAPVPPTQIAAWRAGRLVVDGATVADVVTAIRRYHAGWIVLGDSALASRRITGVFDLHDPIVALRAAVEPHKGDVIAVTPYLLLIRSR